MGMQDSQYSPNMTIQDKINLEKLNNIIKHTPILGEKKISYYLEKLDFMKCAKEAEKNMINVLDENPGLKRWFMSFDPPNYMFNGNPNLHKLAKLVDSDGHSGASFALCCQSVRRKFRNI